MKPFQWVRDEIVHLAEENPDHRSSDKYFSMGKPCCIVGHVLDKLGVSSVGLYLVKETTPLMRNNLPVEDIDWQALDVEPPTDGEALWIKNVQERQDQGYPWGDAVEHA